MLLIQNETNLQSEAARISNAMGLRVFSYTVAFDAATAEAILPFIDTLLLSEIEAQQLQKSRNRLFSHATRPIVSSRFGQSALD